MTATDRMVMDSVKILESREIHSADYEVCVTAQASYDDSSSEMSVKLDSFLRRVEMRRKDEILHPSWLPRTEVVRAHVTFEECSEAAKEILSSWAEKVRRTIPLGDWLEGAVASNCVN